MPNYLLDTDNYSVYVNELSQDASNAPVSRRIATAPLGSVVLSVITYAEVMKGVLNLLQRMAKSDKDTIGYESLVRADFGLHLFDIFPYTDSAHEVFTSFSPAIRRVGRADCQIAAIALASGLTVVTRNTRHFSQIPGVVFEDWTRYK